MSYFCLFAYFMHSLFYLLIYSFYLLLLFIYLQYSLINKCLYVVKEIKNMKFIYLFYCCSFVYLLIYF